MQKLDFVIGEIGDFNEDISDKETWITVKGNHILIKAGETKASAIERFIDAKHKKKKSLKEKVEKTSKKVSETKSKVEELELSAKRLTLLEKKGRKTEWEREMIKHLKNHTWKYAISQVGSKPDPKPKKKPEKKSIPKKKTPIKKSIPKKKEISKKNVPEKKKKSRTKSKSSSFSTMLARRINQRLARPPKDKDEDMLSFTITELGNINDLRFDSIDLSNFSQTTNDSASEGFTVLHGPITRSGDFPYIKNGKKVIYKKEWDNIKEIFSQYSYIPMKATKETGAHHAKVLGYLANWSPNDKTEEMYCDFVLFDKIENLTDVLNPEGGYHVSLGYPDVIKNGNRQILLGLDHGALSLGNKDTGRACYGSNTKGASCTKVKVVNHDQQIMEVMA